MHNMQPLMSCSLFLIFEMVVAVAVVVAVAAVVVLCCLQRPEILLMVSALAMLFVHWIGLNQNGGERRDRLLSSYVESSILQYVEKPKNEWLTIHSKEASTSLVRQTELDP